MLTATKLIITLAAASFVAAADNATQTKTASKVTASPSPMAISSSERSNVSSHTSQFKNGPSVQFSTNVSISSSDQKSNSSEGRTVGVKKGDGLTILSLLSNYTAIMRFTTQGGPRFGVQWHRNSSVLSGTVNPDVAFAVKLFGLIEANDTLPATSRSGTQYVFGKFSWGDILVTNSTIAGSTDVQYTVTVQGTSDSQNNRNPITLDLTAYLSTATYTTADGTIRPTGFKYSINITGSPTYKLTNSYWKLAKITYGSSNSTSALDSSTLADGPSRLNWATSVLVDGLSYNLTRDASLNISIPDAISSTANGTSRDGVLDGRSGKNIVTFTIPKFTSNFYWDPEMYVDEASAALFASSGAFDTTTSDAVATRASFAIAFIAIAIFAL